MQDLSELKGFELMGEITRIKRLFHSNQITWEEAKEMSQPVLDEQNKRGKKIASSYGKGFRNRTFAGLMR